MRDGDEARDRLAAVVGSQVQDRSCWEQAEDHLQTAAMRERLALLGIDPSPQVATALMAAAMLLAEGTAEWGGDARDALAGVAALGFGLLGDA